MNRLTKTISVFTLVFSALGLSQAQLWYNGDPNLVNGLASERNTLISDARVYDDFSFNSGKTITGVFGNFFMDFFTSQAYYEIRTGVSAGSGGTLIASGVIPVTQTPNGFDAFGLTGYRISGSITPVALAGLTQYWLTVAPIGTGSGRAFLQTTSFANSVGNTTSGQAFFDSTYFGYGFTPTVQLGEDQMNYSLGVVPEPASMVALATGLVSLFARRRRK